MNEDTIYIVEYDDTIAAFSDKEKANSFAERFNYDINNIKEIEIDSKILMKAIKRKTDVFYVRMKWDGEVIDTVKRSYVKIKDDNNYLLTFGTKFLYKLNAFDTNCIALNKEHAIKLANKRRLYILKINLLQLLDVNKLLHFNFKTKTYKLLDCYW